jgi:hypothetical protein
VGLCSTVLELELGVRVGSLRLGRFWDLHSTALSITNSRLQILLFDLNIGQRKYLGTCYNHLCKFFNFLPSGASGKVDNCDFLEWELGVGNRSSRLW